MPVVADVTESQTAKPAMPLPWHRDLWRHWWTLYEPRQMPHALLISGLPGIGKRTLARGLSRWLLCQAPTAEGACGQCHSCHMVDAGFHPDWHWLVPESEGKAIRIDQVRALNEVAQQSAQQGGFKVMMVAPAEAMNAYAANALLKTLEEPPKDTLFLLVSDQPSDVLPTIRSRCQQWRLGVPTGPEPVQWLTQHLGDENEARLWLKRTGGRPLTAWKWSQSGTSSHLQQLFEALEAVAFGAEPTEQATRLADIGLTELLNHVQDWLADALRMAVAGPMSVRDDERRPLYQQWLTLAGPRQLLMLEQQCRQWRQQLVRNPNAQLLTEQVLLAFSQVLRGTDQHAQV